MKRSALALSAWLVGASVLGAGLMTHEGVASAAGVTVEIFHDRLSPYGEWIQTRHGAVWRPYPSAVGADFQPYATNGEWVYTDEGWVFESDYEWGWAPFHYGRWYQDSAYGWLWAPDTAWAPSWVDWRYGGGYVGWAPLSPSWVTVSYSRPSTQWVFVEAPHFTERRVWQHALPRERVTTVWQNTAPVSRQRNVRWNPGPSVTHVSAAVGRPVTPVHIDRPRAGVVAPAPIQRGAVVRPSGQAPGRPSIQRPVAPPRTPVVQRPTPAPRGPVVQRPAPAPRPPAVQRPAPAPRGPVVQRPAPAPRPPAVQRPAPAPRGPVVQRPAPAPRPPAVQRPAPAPRGPVVQRPAPAPRPPAVQRPTPAPRAPVIQRPAAQRGPATPPPPPAQKDAHKPQHR